MSYYPSWWEKTVLLRPFDFAVLGAGLIGKQIALKIKKKNPSVRVVLVDRSPISYGASTRNAGFACFGSVSEILDDLKRSSEADVYALLSKRQAGIRRLVEEYGADSIGFRATGSYEIFTDAEELDKALSAYNNINMAIQAHTGLRDTFQVTNAPAGMQVHSKALFNPYEGMLNSGMLNEVISEQVHREGVIPMYGFDVRELDMQSGSVLLRTAEGMELRTSQLILANNAFVSQLLPELDVQAARGQIIVTSEIDGLPFDGIFHADKGYIYFRNLGKRILIGGGRNLFMEQENTTEFRGTDNLRQYLEQYLKTVVLPGVAFSTEMHWSGIMAMGAEKIPVVKRYNKQVCLCVRMSGMGVALGPVLSDELLALL